MISPAFDIPTVESRRSWVIAVVSLVCLGMSFGAPWIAAVGLKAIAADMGGSRSVASLAGSLAWFGAAAGGFLMGPLAERFGIRLTVMAGSVMIAIGLAISTLGDPWALYLGHGIFIGLLGNAGLNAPLYIYVSRWFDKRRGSALALISSGGYIAGFIWPTLFERGIATYGWRTTMIAYGILQLAMIVPLAAIFLHPPPKAAPVAAPVAGAARPTVLGWPPNVVFAVLVCAAFFCCVTMAMPQGHLVALCSDLGMSAALGAAMLSMLLGAGFLSRQLWGVISDRIGGLRTALISSAMQALAMSGFLVVTDEIGIFTVSVAFGVGFSALIPAYVLTVRDLYPANEASWRVPMVLFATGTGMATGGWLAGYLYDQVGHYGPSFAVGVAFNIANLALLATLVGRSTITRRRAAADATATATASA